MPDTLTPTDPKRRRPGRFSRLRGNFLAGLIVVTPIAMTLWLIWTVVGWIDGWVWPFIPSAYQPEELIYAGVKQIAETVFSQRDTSFDKACLVEYPRRGIWAIAFISTSAKGEIAAGIPVEDQKVSVFLPTTPNPTSGFLLFVPKSDVIELDMSVEDAAKLVISAGLVYPNDKDPSSPPAKLAAE